METYSGVGGIGFELTSEKVDLLISHEVFTQDDWENDPDVCLEDAGFCFEKAGGEFTDRGDEIYYLFLKSNNIADAIKEMPSFLEHFNGFGFMLRDIDLLIISDIYAS